MSGEPAVIVDDLHKSFDDLVAVDGVTFDVAPGESFGRSMTKLLHREHMVDLSLKRLYRRITTEDEQ